MNNQSQDQVVVGPAGLFPANKTKDLASNETIPRPLKTQRFSRASVSTHGRGQAEIEHDVYDGRRRLGRLVKTPAGWVAEDASGRKVGIFAQRADAFGAVLKAAAPAP